MQAKLLVWIWTTCISWSYGNWAGPRLGFPLSSQVAPFWASLVGNWKRTWLGSWRNHRQSSGFEASCKGSDLMSKPPVSFVKRGNIHCRKWCLFYQTAQWCCHRHCMCGSMTVQSWARVWGPHFWACSSMMNTLPHLLCAPLRVSIGEKSELIEILSIDIINEELGQLFLPDNATNCWTVKPCWSTKSLIRSVVLSVGGGRALASAIFDLVPSLLPVIIP